MYLHIKDILVLFPQICYTVSRFFDITNPRFNKQMHPVLSEFVTDIVFDVYMINSCYLTEAIADGQYSWCWLVGGNSTCRHNPWGSSCLVWITTARWEFWLVLITVRSEHNQLGTKKLFWNIDISLFNYLLHVHVHPFWNHWWSLQSNWLSWV